MKDKPQLSAEMEKRFDEKFKVLKYEQNGEQHEGFGINHVPNAKDVKHFLATALEEQRKMIVLEIISQLEQIGARGEIDILKYIDFLKNKYIYPILNGKGE